MENTISTVKGAMDKSVVIGTDKLPFDATVLAHPHSVHTRTEISVISYGVCITAGCMTVLPKG